MRAFILMVVVLGGCAVDASAPEPTASDTTKADDAARPSMSDGEDGGQAGVDVCALASLLPDGDICRNVCDPPAMAAQLVAEGADGGNCYQLYCQLTPTEHVLAGVCLAP